MSFAVGIGIVTYNRREILSETIDRVREFTREPNAALVVADDGSSDGTLAMLRDRKVPVVTGINMGIAWNKNRALFLLSHMLGCETVILLEDDTRPTRIGWEAEWIEGVRRWGHVNFAPRWMEQHILSGAGTAADPARSAKLTAQCAAFSSASLTYGGYFDPLFKGYGHEHVEHSRRLVRVGYGGTDERVNGKEVVTFNLLKGDLSVFSTPSFGNAKQEASNLEIAKVRMGCQGYRAPWGKDIELRQFRSEIESAMSDGTERFRLSGVGSSLGRQAGNGVFSRLFHRG